MITYSKAIQEVEVLLEYIKLVEEFKIETVTDLIIHRYALHNSIGKVITSLRDDSMNLVFDYDNLTHDFVRQTILSSPGTDLHKYIRTQYLIKTRPQRRKR